MPRSTPAKKPGFRSHRHLLTAEAVLVMGLIQEWGTQAALASTLWPPVKILFLMAITIGVLGFLILAVQGAVGRAIAALFDAVPIAPTATLHLLVLVGLYLGYAWMWELPWWPGWPRT